MEDRNKRSKIINIVSNVLFGIVMVFLIIFMIYGFGSVANNKVPSFFGQSYVKILTPSMENEAIKDGEVIADGFEPGDVAIIKKVNISEIEIGDIIAFYYCTLPNPAVFEGSDNVLDFETGENSFETSIIFHQVIDIQVDSEGYTWFQTKGTSNVGADKYTRADYVVGVYTPSGLEGFLNFISSSVGIIVLVVIPACIVLFMLLLSIIDTVDKMLKKKREEQEMEAAIMQTINNNQEIKSNKTEQPKDIGLSESTMAEFERQMKKIENEGENQTTEKPVDAKVDLEEAKVSEDNTKQTKPEEKTDVKKAEKTETNSKTEEKPVAKAKAQEEKPSEESSKEESKAEVNSNKQATAKAEPKTAKSSTNKTEVKADSKEKTETKTKTTSSKAEKSAENKSTAKTTKESSSAKTSKPKEKTEGSKTSKQVDNKAETKTKTSSQNTKKNS